MSNPHELSKLMNQQQPTPEEWQKVKEVFKENGPIMINASERPYLFTKIEMSEPISLSWGLIPKQES